jgi:hypothetical protein
MAAVCKSTSPGPLAADFVRSRRARRLQTRSGQPDFDRHLFPSEIGEALSMLDRTVAETVEKAELGGSTSGQ